MSSVSHYHLLHELADPINVLLGYLFGDLVF